MKKFLFVLMTAALALSMSAQKTAVSKSVAFDRNSAPAQKITPLKAFDKNMHSSATMLRDEQVLYSWDFETDDQLDGWMIYDADGDNFNWGIYQYDEYYDYMNYANSGITALVSYSFVSGEGALSPDNYLISPTVVLNGTLSFWTRNYSSLYPDKIAVYVCVGEFDSNNLDALVKVTDFIEPGTTYQEVTVDLSQFAGQEGCFILRHYDCEDEYRIYVDDITITAPAVDMPVNVTVDPAANTAEVAWEDDANVAWNLRYREAAEGMENNLLWDFEEPVADDYALPGGWTSIDADGDGNNWYHLNGVSGLKAHSGLGHVTSASYNGAALSPDNWLVSPQVKLDGELSFWACGQDADYAEEVFAVYVSTDMENWESISEDITAEGVMTEYTFDLTPCGGVDGYIAIRHYNVTDMFRLNVDDIAITYVKPNEWTVVEGVTSPYTIEGLNPETNYEVEVQAINEEGATSAWTPAVPFTTLAGGDEPTDQCAKPEGGFENGVDFHGVMVTLINNETAEGTELHYNITKDGELIIEDAIYDEAFALTEDGEYYIDFWATAPGMLDSSHGGLIFTIDAFTGLSELLEGKTVSAVRYFNVAGQEIAQPEGLTIVVTTYTDGTTNAAKVVK